eukprot:gene39876-49286_t
MGIQGSISTKKVVEVVEPVTIKIVDPFTTPLGKYKMELNNAHIVSKDKHDLFHNWFPNPDEDFKTDRLDFWNNRWRFNHTSQVWNDGSYGNIIKSFEEEEGTLFNPIVDKHGASWVFSVKHNQFFSLENQFPKTNSSFYPGTNDIVAPLRLTEAKKNFVELDNVNLVVNDGTIFYDGHDQ